MDSPNMITIFLLKIKKIMFSLKLSFEVFYSEFYLVFKTNLVL